ETLAAIGVREVAVVDGIHAEALRDRLQLHTLPSVNVRVLANLSWKNLSGSAILAARTWIEDGQRCLVLHGDRPLDLETLRTLANVDGTAIAVATDAEVARGS